jgi:DNA recombination protein RmuC
MDVIVASIGFIAGAVLSYVIFNLLHKAKGISKTDYETLNTKFNDSNTQLKIVEDRNSTQQLELTKLNSKLESKESEYNELQSATASLRTTVANQEQKISEFTASLSEQTSLVSKQQHEINLLNQKCAQESATNRSLVENLDQQKTILKSRDEQIATLTERQNQLISENSTLTANNRALNESIATQKDEITKIQETSLLQFEKVANKILEEKTGKFTDANKANIEALLKPLGEY